MTSERSSCSDQFNCACSVSGGSDIGASDIGASDLCGEASCEAQASSSEGSEWFFVPIPSKVLDEIDVFIWDFDLSLTKMHTIARNDKQIKRSSKLSQEPLMSQNIQDKDSEWYAGNWLMNPSYFVNVVKTLVDIHHKKVAIATHHSYLYFKNSSSSSSEEVKQDEFKGQDDSSLKKSGEKRKFSDVSDLSEAKKESSVDGGSLRRSADGSGSRLLAGADLVLEYLRVAFDMSGEDVNRYFHQGNVVALDCINHPGKLQHLMKILAGLSLVDEKTGMIVDSLVTPVKADGRRYLRVALFDDDPENVFSINRQIEKYVDLSESSSNSDGSYDFYNQGSTYNHGSASHSGEVKIRGIVLPTARGGMFCNEQLWMRGFMAFPDHAVENGRAGFTSDRLVQLKTMLELEEIDSSSSGAFVDDGYDSEEDL